MDIKKGEMEMKNLLMSILFTAMLSLCLSMGTTHAAANSYTGFVISTYLSISANGTMPNEHDKEQVLTDQQAQDVIKAQLSNQGEFANLKNARGTSFTSNGATFIVTDFLGNHTSETTDNHFSAYEIDYHYATSDVDGNVYAVVFNGLLTGNKMSARYSYHENDINGTYYDVQGKFTSEVTPV